MSEEMILKHCAPTLARIKTANMFTCVVNSRKELNAELSKYNKIFRKKGLRILPLRYKNGRALIYVYRPSLLKEDLKHSYAESLLTELGYIPESINMCVRKLSRRMAESGDFPHEIGLFLGYPAEDVQGFIEKGSRSYKCKGYWKVYSDEENALRLFEKYRKCTSVYTDIWSKGRSFEKLVVSA